MTPFTAPAAQGSRSLAGRLARSKRRLALLLPWLAACGGARETAASASAPRALAAEPASLDPAAAPEEALARRWVALSPAYARALGLHEFDGAVADLSAAGIEARIATLRQLQSELAALGTPASADAELDRRVLGRMIAQDLFDLTELDAARTRPAFYSELFGVEEYIVRDYAPKVRRAGAMLEHLKRSRAQVGSVLANLASPLSEPVVRTSIDIYEGFAQYLRGDVQTFLDGVDDAALRADVKALATELGGEAERIARRLEQVELPKGDQSHVLGRERYERLLSAQEALSLPLDELERMAEQDLKRNQAAYDALASRVNRTRPSASELLGEARRMVQGAQSFMLDQGIVGLPSESHVEVKESPPYMRWNGAFLNAGGVFDPPELTAYFYITLPDPAWPAKEQAEYVMTRGEIATVSVHEVFPGHYLQALWQRAAPTFVQKIATSYSFIEGWAHYAEQMMIDEGFASSLPEARLGQLSDALLRDCRFVASIGIHVRGMSMDDVKRRFREDCKQDEATARQQAMRGAFDPGYFAYTLGKLQILALRAEAQQQLGASFDLRKFHEALLSHGAAPIPLLRERVLADLGVR